MLDFFSVFFSSIFYYLDKHLFPNATSHQSLIRSLNDRDLFLEFEFKSQMPTEKNIRILHLASFKPHCLYKENNRAGTLSPRQTQPQTAHRHWSGMCSRRWKRNRLLGSFCLTFITGDSSMNERRGSSGTSLLLMLLLYVALRKGRRPTVKQAIHNVFFQIHCK